MAGLLHLELLTDFFNGIGHQRRFERTPATSETSLRADIRLRRNIRRSGPLSDTLPFRNSATRRRPYTLEKQREKMRARHERIFGEIVNRALLASIALALVVPVTPVYAQQRSDRELAQLRGYSASGTHQCGSEKGRSCVVTGSGFSDCNDATITLQTRDCCPTTPTGGKSSGFVLNYCIQDRAP
jgi:hypothetical protein